VPARVIACLVTISLFAAGCFGEDVPLVETGEVVSAEVTETVSAPAQVTAADRQDVRAEVGGTVAEITVRDGDAVAADDTVVRIDSPQLDQAVEEAERALAELEVTPDVAAADLSGIEPVAVGGNPLEGAVAEFDASVAPQLAAAREALERAAAMPLPELPGEAAGEVVDGLPDKVADEAPEVARARDGADVREAALSEAEAALDALEATHQGVRRALIAAGEAAAQQQRELSSQLDAGIAEAQRAMDAAIADVTGQLVDAQRAQVDATLAEVEGRRAALVVRAPIDGVVQRGRAGAALPDFGGFGDLGGFGLEGLGLDGEIGGAGGGGPGGEASGDASGDGAGVDAPLEVGATVVPGQVLFTVLDQDSWYVDADVDEVDAPAVVEGQVAIVLIDAFPGEEFEGVVESVALTAQRGLTGGVAFPTRVRLLDPPSDPAPRVGMTASVEIATATVTAELAVPARAVVRRDVGTAVYAVRDETAVLVPVELIAQSEELAAVEGDVEPGERVVVAGYEDLADGTRVRTE
jgi:HlyD family secretion protein